MSDNPQHRQHIQDFTRCLEGMSWELQTHYDAQLKQLCDAIAELESRIERLESLASNPEPRKANSPAPAVAADIFITKSSLKKVRDAFMSIFR